MELQIGRIGFLDVRMGMGAKPGAFSTPHSALGQHAAVRRLYSALVGCDRRNSNLDWLKC